MRGAGTVCHMGGHSSVAHVADDGGWSVCYTRGFVRIRIFRIMDDLQDWNDALHRFHPHLSPLPSRERGILSVGLSCVAPPCGFPLSRELRW